MTGRRDGFRSEIPVPQQRAGGRVNEDRVVVIVIVEDPQLVSIGDNIVGPLVSQLAVVVGEAKAGQTEVA
jgi:hypothetical protein